MSRSRHTRFRLILTLFSAVLISVGGVACGGGEDPYDGSPPPDYAKALKGSPPELAAIHAQADELIDGGVDAFDARIEELRGFPVVVNVWASWCGPCRAEFPYFQQLSADMGKRVAFLGVNSQDAKDAAATFLESAPLSYPSFTETGSDIAHSLEATHGLPATAFFDENGERTFTKQGEYRSQEDLEADIQAWAIDGGA